MTVEDLLSVLKNNDFEELKIIAPTVGQRSQLRKKYQEYVTVCTFSNISLKEYVIRFIDYYHISEIVKI